MVNAPKSTTTDSVADRFDARQSVIVRPHLTEKSSRLAELGQYTFLVIRGADKLSVAREIAAKYRVHPRRVTIVRIPGKIVRYGKHVGRRSGIKKAIVALRTGEKIPFGVKT